jgi:hypothetical protein
VASASATLEEQIKHAWNDERFDIVSNFCTYIDHQIKSEFKNMTLADKQAFPSVVGDFYARIEDKKAFGEFYIVGMTRRFIKMARKLEECELPVINAIRRKKSPDFAKPWTEFIKKIKESEELENRFRDEFRKSNSGGNVTFSPLVFDQRTFPLEKNEARRLPPVLEQMHTFFEHLHCKQHPRTKLMLLSDVSIVECKFQVPKNAKAPLQRIYSVSSDIRCASILLAIAERTSGISLREIVEKFGDRNSAGQYLIRLCNKQCPIVRRTATEKKMNDDDVFCLNQQFFFPAAKVTVPPIASERKVDIQKTAEKVELDKVQAIRAAAVRVLKMRNRVEQTQLESEVIQAVAQYFRAEITMIRRELIELEQSDYLERNASTGENILTYKQ